MKRLICGSLFDVLPTLGRFKCLISDPPDNIKLGYSTYKDAMPAEQYRAFLRTSFRLFLEHADIVWISYNAKWTFMVGSIVEDLLLDFDDYEAKHFIQTFTFGQNRRTDCGNGHRPIVRFKHKKAKLYPDAIRVPSWRQLNGDKRADPKGCVPLDVWEFPRVTGNSKQRRKHHPTQLHEGLVKRMIDFSTVPGDCILDVFSGTGTVLRVATDRPVTSVEMDPGYCREIAKEHGLMVEHFQKAA